MARVAVVQIRPELALDRSTADHNRLRAELLLASKLKNATVDVIVLPELAFHGYNFRDRQEIEAVAEPPDGTTYKWCSRMAQTYNAYVAAGYPEVDGECMYNSVCFVGRDGRLLTTYRKHFLYETDTIWATEGPGFQFIDVPDLGRVGFGICMDINPREFRSPFTAFEFARYHLLARTNLVLFSAAWLHRSQPKGVRVEAREGDVQVMDLDETSSGSSDCESLPGEDDAEEGAAESESASEDREALQRFVTAATSAGASRGGHRPAPRATAAEATTPAAPSPKSPDSPTQEPCPPPLPRRRSVSLPGQVVLDTGARPASAPAPAAAVERPRPKPTRTQLYWLTRLAPLLGRPVAFVAANRIGTERNVRFAGGSCVIDLRTAAVAASMGSNDEGVLVASFPVPRAIAAPGSLLYPGLHLPTLPSLADCFAGVLPSIPSLQLPSGPSPSTALGLAGAGYFLASRYSAGVSVPCILPSLFC
eukprot:tig00021590_g22759.t1